MESEGVRVVAVKTSGVAVVIELEIDGRRIYVGFHGPEVVANGWQPYDQPNPAAYIPKSRSELHLFEVAGGELLVSGSTHQAPASAPREFATGVCPRCNAPLLNYNEPCTCNRTGTRSQR